MAYKKSHMGPGALAARPATIGAPQVPSTVSFQNMRPHGVAQASLLGMGDANGIFDDYRDGIFDGLGNGENGNGGASPAWVVPVAVGLIAGGLWVMFSKQRAGGGILPNSDDEPTCNGCGH